jgi:hypothetical protein
VVRCPTMKSRNLAVTLIIVACTRAAPPAQPAPAEANACDSLAYDRDDPGVADAPALCRHFRNELLPEVASAATQCMQAASWSVCDVTRCTSGALASTPVANDSLCASVEQRCPDMTELCRSHVSGMNATGRERFTACLADHCGQGLRYCLWDTMVSGCE